MCGAACARRMGRREPSPSSSLRTDLSSGPHFLPPRALQPPRRPLHDAAAPLGAASNSACPTLLRRRDQQLTEGLAAAYVLCACVTAPRPPQSAGARPRSTRSPRAGRAGPWAPNPAAEGRTPAPLRAGRGGRQSLGSVYVSGLRSDSCRHSGPRATLGRRRRDRPQRACDGPLGPFPGFFEEVVVVPAGVPGKWAPNLPLR